MQQFLKKTGYIGFFLAALIFTAIIMLETSYAGEKHSGATVIERHEKWIILHSANDREGESSIYRKRRPERRYQAKEKEHRCKQGYGRRTHNRDRYDIVPTELYRTRTALHEAQQKLANVDQKVASTEAKLAETRLDLMRTELLIKRLLAERSRPKFRDINYSQKTLQPMMNIRFNPVGTSIKTDDNGYVRHADLGKLVHGVLIAWGCIIDARTGITHHVVFDKQIPQQSVVIIDWCATAKR